MTIKERLDIRAGVKDNDYLGNIMSAMQNIGEETQQINEGDKIALLILERIVQAEVEELAELDKTARSTGGFSSTEDKAQTTPITTPLQSTALNIIPYDEDEIAPRVLRMKKEDIVSCEHIPIRSPIWTNYTDGNSIERRTPDIGYAIGR